jgi:hypothetical protein
MISWRHSAISIQQSAFSNQHSAISIQHSAKDGLPRKGQLAISNWQLAFASRVLCAWLKEKHFTAKDAKSAKEDVYGLQIYFVISPANVFATDQVSRAKASWAGGGMVRKTPKFSLRPLRPLRWMFLG